MKNTLFFSIFLLSLLFSQSSFAADNKLLSYKNCSGLDLNEEKDFKMDGEPTENIFRKNHFNYSAVPISNENESYCAIIDQNKNVIIDVIPTMVSGLCGGQWKPNSSTPIWNHDIGGGRAGVDSIIFPPVERIKGYTKEDATKENIKEIVDNFKCVYTPYNKQDIRDINDFAFYLYKLGAFKPSLEILQDVIKLDPKRTVAYLNIANVYQALGNVQQAKKYYSVYYENMKRDGQLNKVPSRVLKQIKK